MTENSPIRLRLAVARRPACWPYFRALAADGLAVDCVLVDPPYASGARTEATKGSSGAMLRGQRWAARPIHNDQLTTLGFLWFVRHLAGWSYRIMPPGASFLSFIDWRQWPHLAGALETCNLRLCNMVVWDKCSIGLGNGFRVQHELILHAAKGTPRVNARDVPNVLRCPRVANDAHPSPKPVDLLADLLRVTTQPGDLVLDFCAGCGPTLQAARRLGRRAVGIELDAAHCATARARLLAPDPLTQRDLLQ